jgi:hypothetical protein
LPSREARIPHSEATPEVDASIDTPTPSSKTRHHQRAQRLTSHPGITIPHQP